jgi:flagellar hook-associated protein 3 FlgL
MVTRQTKTNINLNKTYVDKYNTQMTTQKKISRASEDPVIAIRSLRLSTSLSHLEQYQSNIDDAVSWLDVTQTSLKNMKDLLSDIRTQCVNGSTDTLSAEDRNTILTSLQQLASGVCGRQFRLYRTHHFYRVPHNTESYL